MLGRRFCPFWGPGNFSGKKRTVQLWGVFCSHGIMEKKDGTSIYKRTLGFCLEKALVLFDGLTFKNRGYG